MRSLAIILLFATACSSTPPKQAQSAPEETRSTTPSAVPMSPGSVPIAPRGVSCGSAVVVDAANENDGVAKEDAWLAENYPGAKRIGQTLITCGDHATAKVEIETANGQKRIVFFDVSKWSGK